MRSISNWLGSVLLVILLQAVSAMNACAAVNSWSAVSGAPANIQAVVVDQSTTHPNETIYVGTTSGISKSTNGGTSWTAINTGLTNMDILSLAIDPNNSTIIYAGTNGAGVWKSTNSGGSWANHTSTTGTLSTSAVYRIAIDPTNSAKIYLGTSTCLWRTVNGGSTAYTQQKFGGGPNGKPVHAVEYDPADTTNAYLGSDIGFYRIINSGTPAAAVGGTLTTADKVNGIAAVNPTTAYIVTYSGTAGKAFKNSAVTTGTAWVEASTFTTATNFALKLYKGVLYAGTSNGIWKSLDAGVNFSSDAISGTTVTSFDATATDPPTIFAGNATGLYSQTLSPTIGTSPVSLAFGSHDVSVSTPLELTVSNTGKGALTVSSIVSGGADSSMFTVASGGANPCGSTTPTINEASSCTVNVTFRPTTPGDKSATLTINSNDVSTPAKTVALTGTGNPLAVLGLSPTSKVFGSVYTGSTSQQLFTVSNSGGATLNVGSAAVTGIDAAQFTLTTGGTSPCTSTTNFSVASGSSCELLVIFAPTTAGAKSAALTLPSNDLATPAVAALSGTGVAVPVVAVSPALKNYGTVNIGATSNQTFTLTNNGIANLVVSGITISGTDAALFSVAPGGASACASLTPTLTPTASCTVVATFAPTTSGAKSASLNIASNDPVTPSKAVSLTGTGNPIAVIGMSPATKDYGTVNIGFTSVQNFTISNSGQANLVVSGITIGGLNPSFYSVVPGGGNPCVSLTPTITPSASCDVTVTFAPTSSGAKTASLDVASNDLVTPTKSVAITGTGNSIPIISVSPTSVPFGTVNVNASSTQTLSVSNIGQASMTVSSMVTSGVNAAKFSVVPGGGSACANLTPTIAAGASCTVNVTFSPTASGAQSASLDISSNDPNTATKNISLTGTGNPLPVIALNPAPASFGSSAVGAGVPLQFTISNTGQASLAVSSISFSGTNSAMFAVSTGGTNACATLTPTITAAGSCTFLVTFTPTAVGAMSATLNIVSNDPLNGTKSAALSGTGVGVAGLTVNPPAIVYGNKEVGAAELLDFTIKNSGSSDLTVSSMTVGGVDSSMFAVSLGGASPCPTLNPTLTAGSSCTLTATFLPLSVGDKAAAFTIVSNTPGSPNIVNLSGHGISNVPSAFVIVNGGLKAISNSSSISFNAAGSDIPAYKWKVDSGLWSAEVPVTKMSTKAGLTHGSHTLYVVGKSISGYWPDFASAITATWFTDLKKPVTTVSVAGGTYPADQTVTLSATDEGAPAAADPVIYYTTNGATPTLASSKITKTGDITITLSSSSPKVTLKYFAVDAGGNAEVVKTVVYAYVPVATISGVPSIPTNLTAVAFKVGGPGVVAYKYAIDTAPLTTIEALVGTALVKTGLAVGDHTVKVIGKNSLGAWQDVATEATWTIEKVAPSTTLDVAPGSYSGSKSVTLSTEAGAKIYYTLNGATPTVASPSFTTSGSVSVTLTAAIPKTTLKYFAKDTSGNIEPVKTALYYFDPVATITGAPTGTNNLKTASITVGGAGVVAYKYTIGGGAQSAEIPVATKIAIPALANGDYTVLVIGKNAGGAWQATATVVSWTTDISAPGTLAATPPGGTFTNVQAVALSSDDPAAKIYYTTNGATPTVTSTLYSGPITVYYTTTIKFIAIDVYGNVSPVKSDTYTLAAHAQISAGLPASPSNKTSLALTVGGTGVTAYKYNLNSSDLTGAVETPVATKISLGGLSQGLQTLYIIGKNAASVWQTTPTQVSWVVDLTAPTTTATAGGVFSGLKTVSLLCDDSKATIYYTTNGTAPALASTKYSGAFNFTTTTILKFFAVDPAGNSEAVQTVVYEILPVAAATPVPPAFSKSSSLTLKVGGSNVTHYKYTFDGGSESVETPIATPIVLSALAAGSHTLSIAGKNAGNTWQTTSTVLTWVTDLTAPATTATFDSGTNTVTLSTVDANAATIYYTVTGATPTVTSPVYTAPFVVSANTAVKFFAKDAAGNLELTQTALYRPVALFSGVPTVTKITAVSIGVTGKGVTAYKYQLEKNGTVVVPWTGETLTSVKIVKGLATGTYKLSAVAKLVSGTNILWQDQGAASEVTFKIDTVLPTKTTISPAPGLYYLPQTITLTSPSSDQIYYTTNGTVPTARSTKYTSAGISISTTTKLNFMAIDAAGNMEAVQKVVYQIPPTSSVTGLPDVTAADITFGVTGTNVVAFKYKVDSGQWSGEFKSTSKISIFGIPSGDHILSVISKDAGGSWQAVPTKRAWTVQ